MNNTFHLSARLNCNVKEAFAFFTQNSLLESWLTQQADVLAQVNGKYELFWEPANKHSNSTLGCEISALEKNQLLSFNWKSPSQFAHFANNANSLTHVVVSFVAVNGATVVHLVHSGWQQGNDWQQAKTWQQHAWQLAFKRLQSLTQP